jgi:type IV secretory pathway protease TraF
MQFTYIMQIVGLLKAKDKCIVHLSDGGNVADVKVPWSVGRQMRLLDCWTLTRVVNQQEVFKLIEKGNTNYNQDV